MLCVTLQPRWFVTQATVAIMPRARAARLVCLLNAGLLQWAVSSGEIRVYMGSPICRLTNNLRALLRRYEQRPPPLSPLAAALRGVCTLTANPETVDTTPR